MIDPIAVGETKDYVLKQEEKSESPTVWIIGALDSIEKARILRSQLALSSEEDGTPKIERISSEESNDFSIVKFGLKGWKNFGTLEFKTEKVKLFDREADAIPDDLLRRIPLLAIFELAGVIWGENQVGEDLAKN